MPVLELLPVRDLRDCCAPITREPVSAANAASLAASLKALADPARLRILSIVAASEDQETCVCNFTEPLELSQPTVSHHLKVLVDAGFLEREKRGTWAYYRIVPGSLDDVAGLIATV
ncbi:MAG: transcriptional regulator [Micrococcales bacterium 73-13]|nr:MAG: transcriptional regulator [Micrococcales bacterium 73-13]